MSNSAITSRATRLRRIPVRITHHSQAAPAPDWSAIETAIERTFTPEQRDRLAAILAHYRRDAPAARTASPVKEAADRLAAMEEAALAFRNAILKAASSGMAEAYARSVLEKFMRSTGSRDVDLDALWRIASDTAWAARAAANDVGHAEQPSTDEKHPWRTMVRDIRALAKEIGMSLTMDSKHPCRHPFPRLVLAIHDSFADAPGWRPTEDSIIPAIREALKN